MKFTLRIILFFFLLVSFLACVRHSGRKSETRGKNNSYQSDIKKNGRDIKTIQMPTPITQSTSLRKMTGVEIFEKYNSAVFMIFTSDGLIGYQGSGFFISDTGIGVSNYHVFEGTTIGYEQIKLTNDKIYRVKNIIAKDKEHDFIIFQIEGGGTKFNFIPIERRQSQVGEKVFAIGSPRGLENTFSSGEISQVRSNSLIQINVPIDHGSSGGALINEYGNVIGITVGGYDDSGANLNFAINIDVLKPYLK